MLKYFDLEYQNEEKHIIFTKCVHIFIFKNIFATLNFVKLLYIKIVYIIHFNAKLN